MRTKEICETCGRQIDKVRQSLELTHCEDCAKKIPGNILQTAVTNVGGGMSDYAVLVDMQIKGMLDLIPDHVLVREGGGKINWLASAAVSLAKLHRECLNLRLQIGGIRAILDADKGNAMPTKSVDAREVKCLKCGASFNLREEHTCHEGPII